mgnify:CR=1 FL=1
MKPRFSIITCTLNSEKFLLDNINSVKKQIFKNYEHIFIDGFSIDKTVNIIKLYQKEYPDKVKFYQFPKKGIANAFNKGIEESKGEYLFFLNSDDYFYDENVLKDVDEFLSKNDYDWIYGQINVVDENGTSRGLWPTKKYLQCNHKSFFCRYLLKFYSYIPHQAVFIKKDVFDKNGLFWEDLIYFPDLEYWLRIRNTTKWCFVNRVIANYRVHPSSNSMSFENEKLHKESALKRSKRHLNFLERIIAFLFGKMVLFLRSKNIIIKDRNKI